MRHLPRTVGLVTAVLAAGAASAASADAASRLVIRGAGFGHGVGMSQYGALGFARQGTGYREILGHYYTDTEIGRLGGPSEVRVLLAGVARAPVSGVTGVEGGRSLQPGTTYTTTRGPSGDRVTLRTPSGRSLGTYAAPLRLTASDSGASVAGGRYRGAVELRPGTLGGIQVVNAVGLEDYVRGVVSRESPSSWPAEALKAQAVAARTYAITTSKNGVGFDHYQDTRSQVYGGIAAETPSTDAAVAATAGEVVTHAGRPVVTYFFSTSGGRTEDVENSFIGAEPQPWLKSVEDPHDDVSPRHRWIVRMSLRETARRLSGLVKGSFRRIRVLKRGRSPRVVSAEIVGSGGRTRVSGPTLRTRLGLDDHWATFTVITTRATKPERGEPAIEQEGGSSAGGARPRAATAAFRPPRGIVAGRVAPLRPGAPVAIQRLRRGGWVTVSEPKTGPKGRYRAAVMRPGRYRVQYRREQGPTVRVR